MRWNEEDRANAFNCFFLIVYLIVLSFVKMRRGSNREREREREREKSGEYVGASVPLAHAYI